MRTRWLGLAAVALLLTGSAPPHAWPGPTARPVRPNIIFILTDDLDTEYPDGSWIDYFPGLKADLAERGTTFSNFFVSLSLCCPSRASILRGQYAHNTQIFTNGGAGGGFQKAHDLGLEDSTMATWLQDAGYRTVLLGKYLNGYPGDLDKTYVPPGWDEWYAGEAGQYEQFDYDLNENGKVVHYGTAPGDYLQDVLDDKAVDFIQRSTKAGQQPFFMWMTTISPHMPATSAPRYAGAFPDAQAPRPPTFNEKDVSHHPQWVRNRPLLTDEEIDQIDVLYRKRLRSMLAVQDTVRDLIATLRATGQVDNTYIFFSSDNGFHMGQHRLNPGKNTEFEEDLHVPLIVRGPGVPAYRTVDRLALNIDFAPTFAELAAIPAPRTVDGRSLVPLLGSKPAGSVRWRQAFLIEHGFIPTGDVGRTAAEVGATQEPPDPFDLALPVLPQPFDGVHTDDIVYAEYLTTGEVELYDLGTDIYEHTSIAGQDPELDAFLAAWLDQLRDCAGAGCRAAEDNPPSSHPSHARRAPRADATWSRGALRRESA